MIANNYVFLLAIIAPNLTLMSFARASWLTLLCGGVQLTVNYSGVTLKFDNDSFQTLVSIDQDGATITASHNNAVTIPFTVRTDGYVYVLTVSGGSALLPNQKNTGVIINKPTGKYYMAYEETIGNGFYRVVDEGKCVPLTGKSEFLSWSPATTARPRSQ